MKSEEFVRIRQYLGKSQSKLAQLLCISTKAVQSFEQSWRKIPVYIERELLVLLAVKKGSLRNEIPCWEVKRCGDSCREACIIWEYKANHCWLISGTMCEGKTQKSWEQKISICRKCAVFKALIPPEASSEIK